MELFIVVALALIAASAGLVGWVVVRDLERIEDRADLDPSESLLIPEVLAARHGTRPSGVPEPAGRLCKPSRTGRTWLPCR